QVLRGQFRFLAVYFTAIVPREEGLDSLRWEPVIYGLPPKKPDRSVTEAITDLSGGADDKFNSLPPYRQEEALSFVWQSFNARLLFSLGLIEAESESELPDREREWLHDASVDLEKALRKRTDLPSAYRSILARS